MPRIVISVPGKKPQPYRFPLDRECTTLGRSPDNDIVIDDPSISSFHAEMQRAKGRVILRDMGSTNGIKLGEEDMEVIELVPDIDVVLGDIPFEAEFSADELAELEKEGGSPLQKAKTAEKTAEDSPSSSTDGPKMKLSSDTAPVKIRRESAAAPIALSEGGLSISTVILIAALAFFIGLAIRHFIETGQFILGSI